MNDQDLRKRVFDALDFSPIIDATSVSVSVLDGVACLRGRTETAEQKASIVATVQSVPGIGAVADEIMVSLTPRREAVDEDLARQIAGIIRHSAGLDGSDIRVCVEDGHVTLSGDVDSFFLPKEIEAQVKSIEGVHSVTNGINIRLDPSANSVLSSIREVFQRDLFVTPEKLEVSVFGGTATLTGEVHDEAERALATHAAAIVSGITYVDNRLVIISAH